MKLRTVASLGSRAGAGELAFQAVQVKTRVLMKLPRKVEPKTPPLHSVQHYLKEKVYEFKS